MQEWDDFQYSLLGQNGLTEITNVGSAQINGLEMDLSWAATDRLSITAGVSFLNSELTDNYCGFYDENLQPVKTADCARRDPDTDEVFFSNPEAPDGTQLPIMPEVKGNLTARYEFQIGALNAHVQGAVVYVGERESDLRIAERELMGNLPSYTIADFTAGIGNDSWTLELIIANAFDERAELGKTTQCSEILTFDLGTTYDKSDDFSTPLCGAQPYVFTAPPRGIGLKFSQRF
jgi:outer membrane receptor protein involved in Fe transport